MKVYLIAGKAGSGKTKCANYIKEYYEVKGKKVLVTEVSKYLKIYAKELLLWDEDSSNKPRKFLQDSGYYIRHELFSDDFLINRLIEDAKFYEKYLDVLIVSDIRFPKEVEMLKQNLGGITIKVINNFGENNLSIDEKSHETEIALDNYTNFDYILDNNDLNSLEAKLDEIIEKEDKNEK